MLSVEVPYSTFKAEMLRILKKNKYVVSYEVSEDKRSIAVALNNVRETLYIPSFDEFLDLVNEFMSKRQILKSHATVTVFISSLLQRESLLDTRLALSV